MRLEPLEVEGAWLITVEPRADERGWFGRAFCREEFSARGLATEWVQMNVSVSERKHTLRGMHWQATPHEEIKLVRCTRGLFYDVVADVRPTSPTHGRWAAVELGPQRAQWLYVPAGCAHGFLTLEDDTEALYLVSNFYCPEAEQGLRYDDSFFSVLWPAEPAAISGKDAGWPAYRP
jgi:dTDP-4-dehydrorhamnose 3,5-epimerase